MGDTHTMETMDEATVVRGIRELVGQLTDDEAALVRTLTPADLTEAAMAEHLFDLVDLLATIRFEEAMAEYVYAIAPGWDGTIETLLLAGRVTTAFTRFELESCGGSTLDTPERLAPVRRARLHRMPVSVG
jgi:hypothetical protein